MPGARPLPIGFPTLMVLALTREQQHTWDRFRRFVAEVLRPDADRFDCDQQLPSSLLDALAAGGYWGLTIPREHGGGGGDMITCGLLHEELGRGCSSTRAILTVHGMTAEAIARWGTTRQREQWLPPMATGRVIGAFALSEPLAGSDALAVRTSAVADGGGFRLDGQKLWVTAGQIAGVYLVIARCEGQPTAFLVPGQSPGLTVTPVQGMLGLRAAMLADLTLDGCRVPADAMLGRTGFGVTHVAFTALDYGRYTVAWGCVGLAQACLEESLRHSGRRQQFGALLKDHQLIARMLTDMITNVRAARLLCEHAAMLRDAGDPDAIVATLIAKYFASTAAHRIADDCVQMHGAVGCSPSSPVQRYFRDAKVMEIIEGSTQIQQLTIAKYMFQL